LWIVGLFVLVRDCAVFMVVYTSEGEASCKKVHVTPV